MNEATWVGVAMAALALVGTVASNIIGLFRYKVEVSNTKEMLQLQAKTQYQEKQIQELTATVDSLKVKQEEDKEEWKEKLDACEERHDVKEKKIDAMHDEIMVMRMMMGKPKDGSEAHIPLPSTESKKDV